MTTLSQAVLAEPGKFNIGGVFSAEVMRHESVQRAIDDHDPEKEAWARHQVMKRGWTRTKEGFFVRDQERTPNLIPTQGLNFILNLVLSSRSKVTSWYHGPFTSNWTPTAGAKSNWAGASAGPLATELADAQFVETDRQGASFDTADAGSIASSAPTQITIQTGVTNLTVYGTTLNSAQAVNYNMTDQVLLAATRFTNPKSGLGEADVLNLSYTLTATSV